MVIKVLIVAQVKVNDILEETTIISMMRILMMMIVWMVNKGENLVTHCPQPSAGSPPPNFGEFVRIVHSSPDP